MPLQTTQVSANISVETKRRLQSYAEEFGVKKGYVVEMALLHHLNALEQLPSDVVIPPVVVVSRDEGGKILDRIENPPPPTDAMQALFDDAD